MTYSNFARRKGSKDKKKRKGSVAGTAAKALGAGALGYAALKNREALGALGASVAARTRNVVQTAAAQGAYGARVARTKAGELYQQSGASKVVRRGKRKAAVAVEKTKRTLGLSKKKQNKNSSPVPIVGP